MVERIKTPIPTQTVRMVKRETRFHSSKYIRVLPENLIRTFYQPTGHTSNWVTADSMATK